MIRTSWKRYRPVKVDTGGESKLVQGEDFVRVYGSLLMKENAPTTMDVLACEDVLPQDVLVSEEIADEYEVTNVQRIPSGLIKTLSLQRIER